VRTVGNSCASASANVMYGGGASVLLPEVDERMSRASGWPLAPCQALSARSAVTTGGLRRPILAQVSGERRKDTRGPWETKVVMRRDSNTKIGRGLVYIEQEESDHT
jgi:hypothetical protein